MQGAIDSSQHRLRGVPGFHALDCDVSLFTANRKIRVLGKLAPQRFQLLLLLLICISASTAGSGEHGKVIIQQLDFGFDVALKLFQVRRAFLFGNTESKTRPLSVEHRLNGTPELLRNNTQRLIPKPFPARVKGVDVTFCLICQRGTTRTNITGKAGGIPLTGCCIIRAARRREIRPAVNL
ncbi:hypothetical protein D3C80_1483720 [compost metagenome]